MPIFIPDPDRKAQLLRIRYSGGRLYYIRYEIPFSFKVVSVEKHSVHFNIRVNQKAHGIKYAPLKRCGTNRAERKSVDTLFLLQIRYDNHRDLYVCVCILCKVMHVSCKVLRPVYC